MSPSRATIHAPRPTTASAKTRGLEPGPTLRSAFREATTRAWSKTDDFFSTGFSGSFMYSNIGRRGGTTAPTAPTAASAEHASRLPHEPLRGHVRQQHQRQQRVGGPEWRNANPQRRHGAINHGGTASARNGICELVCVAVGRMTIERLQDTSPRVVNAGGCGVAPTAPTAACVTFTRRGRTGGCSDSCPTAGDGLCTDGGPGSYRRAELIPGA